jgi:hypothetical protein
MSRKLAIVTAVILSAAALASTACAARITFDDAGVLQIDGRKTFVLSFSIPPPPDGRTPEGTDGFEELKSGGVNFFRIAPRKEEPEGSEAANKRLRDWLDAAAAHQMYCWITLGQLPAIKPGEVKKEKLLRSIISRFKDHPGLGRGRRTMKRRG